MRLSFLLSHCLAITLVAVATPAWAGSQYIIIGGGPKPDAAQISIEKNVIWTQSVFKDFAFSYGETWYGAGPGPIDDVVFLAPESAQSKHWEPLARLYGSYRSNSYEYRPNQVSNNQGSFSEKNVSKALQNIVGNLQASDDLLIIYSGHGSYEPRHPVDNAFRLWGETRYSAKDLNALLRKAPDGSNIRFVTPQCFSGAFMRSVFSDPENPSATDIMPQHCGFASVPENKVSEGCTPAIDVGDYRDYTTYFLAAIDGKTRTGAPLNRDPDIDRDGRVSLLEAHYYAFTEAHSTDIPRSTSEYFLEQTQHWYDRWPVSAPGNPDNPYIKVAQRLAERLNIDSPSGGEVLKMRRRQASEIKHLEQEINALSHSEKVKRLNLQKRFELQWPRAGNAHSSAFNQFITEKGSDAVNWIQSQPEYPQLVEIQDELYQKELELLEKNRQMAQIEKLQRALHLATLLDNFKKNASTLESETYKQLTTCESWSPPPSNGN